MVAGRASEFFGQHYKPVAIFRKGLGPETAPEFKRLEPGLLQGRAHAFPCIQAAEKAFCPCLAGALHYLSPRIERAVLVQLPLFQVVMVAHIPPVARDKILAHEIPVNYVYKEKPAGLESARRAFQGPDIVGEFKEIAESIKQNL